jgi:hypothetical protein
MGNISFQFINNLSIIQCGHQASSQPIDRNCFGVTTIITGHCTAFVVLRVESDLRCSINILQCRYFSTKSTHFNAAIDSAGTCIENIDAGERLVEKSNEIVLSRNISRQSPLRSDSIQITCRLQIYKAYRANGWSAYFRICLPEQIIYELK